MKPLSLAIGTYARNGGEGLQMLSMDAEGQWSLGPVYREARNASFGAYSRKHDIVYLVDEDGDTLGSYRYEDGEWTRVASTSTQGAQPCYVALDPSNSRLAIAHYGSGSLANFALDEQGVPSAEPIMQEHSGGGPIAERQEGPHAHCACFSPDGRWLYHVDLGTDEVLACAVDLTTGAARDPTVPYSAPPGSGPRHLVFHPEHPSALLISELASTLTLLEAREGEFKPISIQSTLPAQFTGESLGGHLSVNSRGDRIYVSNRGHDSIAVFAWSHDGALQLLQHLGSGGASPRAFVLLEAERQLVVANEEAGNVVTFDVMPDGTLSGPRSTVEVPGAVFPLVLPDW